MKKKRPIQRYVPKEHLRPRPIDLRRETQQRVIAHLLLMGWSVPRIARRLHCSERAVRWRMDKEEFQRLFDQMQQDHFKTVHRKLGGLLHEAANALDKMLKHSDWRAKNAAIEHILRVHGKYIDKVDVSGTLDHSGQVRHVQAELVDSPMSDEMRQKARGLLVLQREMFQRQLPAKFASSHNSHNDPVNGRFTRTNDHSDEERD